MSEQNGGTEELVAAILEAATVRGFLSPVPEVTELVATAISNTAGQNELSRLASEQAALRRVATLVAQGGSPQDVFAAVAREVGLLLGVEAAYLARFNRNGTATGVATWSAEGEIPVGRQVALDGDSVVAIIARTSRPARVDSYTHVDGEAAALVREIGLGASVGAPIIVEQRLWGALIVSRRQDGVPLPPDTEARVDAFTELVAAAISNTESRIEVTQLADEQAALRRVAELVAREAAPAEIFTAIAAEIGQLLGTDAMRMMRYESDGDTTVVAAAGTRGDVFPIGSRWPLGGDDVTSRVIRTGRPARIDNYRTGTGRIAETVRSTDLRGVVGTPILVQGRVWGTMLTGTFSDDPLPPDITSRLGQFTELMATAIANAEARAQVRRLLDEQAALRRVATLVAGGAGPAEVFSAVSDEIGRLFGSEQAAVARFEHDGAEMVVAGISHGVRGVSIGTRWALEDFLASTQVYRTARPARTDGSRIRAATGPIANDLREIGAVSSVAAPIIVEGTLWGVVTVSDMHEVLPVDAEQRLEKFTELVATAIANAESRAELAASEAHARRLGREQAALRRVATLVARSAPADEVFSAVAREAAHVFDVELVMISRYEADTLLVLSSFGTPACAVGSRWPLDAPSLPGSIYHTGSPGRIDDYADATGLDAIARDWGIRSAVGVPIIVDGTVWGSTMIASTDDEPLAADAEGRLARFTELVATSVSNTTMRGELAASRARLVAAADEERRRVVRDLHDGAQQRLVHTTMTLKRARRAVEQNHQDALRLLDQALGHAQAATDELRDLARGILPAILTDGGLRAGVDALASRMPIDVETDIPEARLPATVEATAYFVVAEAFTNVVKHAHAHRVNVSGQIDTGWLQLQVRDDGIGGVRRRGSGLTGLRDRVAALDGHLRIEAPADGGTLITASIPIGSGPTRPTPNDTPRR